MGFSLAGSNPAVIDIFSRSVCCSWSYDHVEVHLDTIFNLMRSFYLRIHDWFAIQRHLQSVQGERTTSSHVRKSVINKLNCILLPYRIKSFHTLLF